MDGLDALLADAAAEAQAKKQLASAKKPSAPPRAEPPRVTATKSSDASEPYLRRLKEFIALLLDPAVLDAIASDLRSGRTYDELTKYVAERFLGEYTLTQELHRMEYVVVTADGAELTTPDSIRDHAKANPAVLRDVLLQMANQSLLATLLEGLQTRWMDVELSTCVNAAKCAFRVDLRARVLEAQCRLVVLTVGGSEPLELAASDASVRVDEHARSIAWSVPKPTLSRCCVFEEAMIGVANVLAQGAELGGPALLPTSAAAVPPEPSVDDVAKRFEEFLADDADDAPAAAAGGGGLLSGVTGLFSSLASPAAPTLYRRDG